MALSLLKAMGGKGAIVVDIDTRKVRHVDNGVLYLEDTPDLSVRLVELATRLREVVVDTRPDFAAVEDIFVDLVHGAAKKDASKEDSARKNAARDDGAKKEAAS